ncbi:MAG: hypothetical protein GY711_17940 [bacterium]|nr:hypothetical protein [bacterium]
MHAPAPIIVRPGVAATALLCILQGCATAPEDRYDVIGRSALFTTTATAPAGVLEVELGSSMDPDERTETTLALKYGLTDAAELSLEHKPYVEVDRPGRDARGTGDVAVAPTGKASALRSRSAWLPSCP